MKSTYKIIIPLFVLFALITGAANAGNNKVNICHIPPGNPANFHTITVTENTYSSHLAHGDLAGACDAACAILCDDGNACTIDDTGDCEQQGCPVVPEAVDCNDGNECTFDTCDPVEACVNAPQEGQLCDDNEICSGPDQCNAEGACVGPAIDNCCLGDEDCSQNLCDQAACNLVTNRCEDDPVQCDPSNLCQVSMCAPDDGMCYETPIMCGEGESCNPSNGECEAAVKTVFVTSRPLYSGNLGGLAGADAKCQAKADNAGLTGTYVAWLSTQGTASVNAKDRIPDAEYRRVDGELVATSKADLLDGTLAYAILLMETGVPTTSDPPGTNKVGAYTGTLADGTVITGKTCNSWTSSAGGGFAMARTGTSNSVTSTWTDRANRNCNDQFFRLYCFEL